MSNFTPRSVDQEIMEASYDRPAGVSLLAVLLAIGGVILLGTQLLAFSKLNEASTLIGVSSYFFQAAIGFLGLIGIAAAVGMWLGKKWGWWLALFYFAYAVTRNINVLISISSIYGQYSMPTNQITMNYIKYGIRALWNCFLLFYLCRETASTYFRTLETKKWKSLSIVFGICVVIFLSSSLLQR
ncbi:hypothetical protein [Paenibacillus sp. SI8]|uniref:hypothetical protein n=1 Tax=unclassified Paenibacillus TaxID=185978 RepID=UPI003465244D